MNEKPKVALTAISPFQDGAFCIPDAEGHCITCSDEAVRVTVLRVDEETEVAQVKVQAQAEEVDISLIECVAPGDVLLVHGGVAIGRVEETNDD